MTKKTQTQLKELSSQLDDETRQREEQHALATKAEKRANDLTLELEELKANLEQVCMYVQRMETEEASV